MGVLSSFIQEEFGSILEDLTSAIPATSAIQSKQSSINGSCVSDPRWDASSQIRTKGFMLIRNIVRDEECLINLKVKDSQCHDAALLKNEEQNRIRTFCFNEHVRLFKYAPIPLSARANDAEMLECFKKYTGNEEITIVYERFRLTWEATRSLWFTKIQSAAEIDKKDAAEPKEL
jgi:hypothetical protein